MATYRIYFIGETVIRGRDDFEADNDQAAIQIAHALFDACSDNCRSFDLWQQICRVAVPRLFEPTTFDELSAANQERVIETRTDRSQRVAHCPEPRAYSKGSSEKKTEEGLRYVS